MKYLSGILLITVLLFGCGINKQANQIQTLENCLYEITSADSVYLAGKDVTKLIANKQVNLSSIPGVAMGYFNKSIPMTARVNLKISNPTKDVAGINKFEYLVLIKGQQIAEGIMNQKVTIAPGDSLIVPVMVNANMYKILSDGKTLQEVVEFIQGGKDSSTEKKGVVTLKIKPTFEVGQKLVNYPGYITINKEVSSKILF